jgi:hypothetical protein
MTSTSDNAVGYMHRLDGSDRIAVQYGAMANTLVGGVTLGNPNHRLRQPAELHIPIMGASFDGVYASAILTELPATEESRRLAAVADWLDVAWRNSRRFEPSRRIAR